MLLCVSEPAPSSDWLMVIIPPNAAAEALRELGGEEEEEEEEEEDLFQLVVIHLLIDVPPPQVTPPHLCPLSQREHLSPSSWPSMKVTPFITNKQNTFLMQFCLIPKKHFYSNIFDSPLKRLPLAALQPWCSRGQRSEVRGQRSRRPGAGSAPLQSGAPLPPPLHHLTPRAEPGSGAR